MSAHSNSNQTDRRREQRVAVDATVAILCSDRQGRESRLDAQLIEISVKGARMRVSLQLSKGTTVYFFSHQLCIAGRGAVRYCDLREDVYEVGIEFPGGTGWKGAESADLQALAAKVTGQPAIVETETKA